MRKIFIKILWGILIGIVVIATVGTIAIWNGWVGYMPDMDDLQNPISKYSSQVYSADGKLMGTYASTRDNRISASFDNISPYLINALIATEDERFYEHSGIDFKALSRAILKRGLMGNENAGGGSTITQQLSKQLYSEVAHSKLERLFQKPIEWVIAIKLEKNFTKEEIITMYLNYFDFLYNAIGVKSACMTYFSKDPKNISITEAATIIGLCKNPSYYNPVRFPDRSLERRNVVLTQMYRAGYITKEDCHKYMEMPLNLKFQASGDRETTDGIAPYFREYLRQYMMAKKPELKDYPSYNRAQFTIDSIAWEEDPLYGWCNKNTRRGGHPYNINTDGLINLTAEQKEKLATIETLEEFKTWFNYSLQVPGTTQNCKDYLSNTSWDTMKNDPNNMFIIFKGRGWIK